MEKREWLQLARIINGGTVYGKADLINKKSLVAALNNWLLEVGDYYEEDVFAAACVGKTIKDN